MTVKEIRINAQLMCNKTIDKNICINYINEAIRDIALRDKNSGEERKRTFFALNSKWYDIKEKDEYNRKVLKLKYIIDEHNCKTKLYHKAGDDIMFDLSGNYTIYYVLLPKYIKSEEDTPSLSDSYLDAVSAFCAYKERTRFYGADDETSKLLYTLYLDRIERAY